eukprot:12815754-Prorocentrum_lima.AAC.1
MTGSRHRKSRTNRLKSSGPTGITRRTREKVRPHPGGMTGCHHQKSRNIVACNPWGSTTDQ